MRPRIQPDNCALCNKPRVAPLPEIPADLRTSMNFSEDGWNYFYCWDCRYFIKIKSETSSPSTGEGKGEGEEY